MIKLYGPIVLCHPDVQTLLMEWLSDKKNAHKKLGKLSASLLEYSVGPGVLTTRFKPGPAAIKILRSNANEIKQAHKVLTENLGLLKKGRKKIVDFKAFVSKEGGEIGALLKKNPGKDETRELLQVFSYIHFLLKIIEVLDADKELREQYETFGWQPNKLAKSIMMKVLNISESKMDKALYPNKKSAPAS